jgi:pimeloyl-ACP methyl ester carboxylesterase
MINDPWPTATSIVRRNLLIEGRRVAYVDLGGAEGAGAEACLLLHGLAASWEWWGPVLPGLAADRRVVALDLPGFGASDPPESSESYTATDLVRTIEAVCCALGLGRVALVGHSMGTMLACELAYRHPERVSRLVLVGGPVISVVRLMQDPMRTLKERPEVATFFIEALTAGLRLPPSVRDRIASSNILRRLALAPYVHKPARLGHAPAAVLLAGGGAPGVWPMLRACRRYDMVPGLSGVLCPTLLLGGVEDRIAPPADLAEFAAATPNARIELLPDTAHWSMAEQPSQAIRLIRQFLAEPVANVEHGRTATRHLGYQRDLDTVAQSEVFGEATFAAAARWTRRPDRRRVWEVLRALEAQTKSRLDAYLSDHGVSADPGHMTRARGMLAGVVLALLPWRVAMWLLERATPPTLAAFERLAAHAPSDTSPFFEYLVAREQAIAAVSRAARRHDAEASDSLGPVVALLP